MSSLRRWALGFAACPLLCLLLGAWLSMRAPKRVEEVNPAGFRASSPAICARRAPATETR